MYKSIRIKNFRGIKDLEINDLGRVNLIVGANNVGKSSVLEALALLNSENDPALLLEMAEARGFAVNQLSPELLFSTIRDQTSIQRPSIEARESGLLERLSLMFPDGFSSENDETKLRQQNFITLSDSRSELSGILELSFAVSRLAMHPQEFRQAATSVAMKSNWREVIDRKLGSMRPTVWMPSSLILSPIELSERFAELKEARREGAVLDALQRLDSRVQEIYLAFNKFGFNDVRPLIHVHMKDLQKAIPLRMLGGGASRLTDLLVSLPVATNGVFLVDEIDNGIYHENLQSLWGAVDAGSRSADSQVFATTHSWECVNAAVEAFRTDPEAFRMFRLSREGGELHAVPYDHSVALAATTGFVEVR